MEDFNYMSILIEVDKLTKSFGPFIAVDNISFSLKRGEVLGFLGPNGAGKTTTMRMITGFLPPTAGEIMISKHNIPKKNVFQHLFLILIHHFLIFSFFEQNNQIS